MPGLERMALWLEAQRRETLRALEDHNLAIGRLRAVHGTSMADRARERHEELTLLAWSKVEEMRQGLELIDGLRCRVLETIGSWD